MHVIKSSLKCAHFCPIVPNTGHSHKMSNTQRKIPVDISCNLQLTINKDVCKREGICVCVCVFVYYILSLWSHLYSLCVQNDIMFSANHVLSPVGTGSSPSSSRASDIGPFDCSSSPLPALDKTSIQRRCSSSQSALK